MTAQRDPDRLIHAFIEQGQSVLPDRVYDALRDQVEQTPQRAGWLAGRFSLMNNTAFRYGIGAVAVIFIAILALRFLPGSNLGGPQETPSPTAVASASATRAATASSVGFPGGVLAAGDYTVRVDQVLVDFTLTDGWTGNDNWYVSKHAGSGSMYIVFWKMPDEANVYTDPCGHALADPPIGSSVAELADGLAAISGVEASEPSPIEIGGYAGEMVSLVLPTDASCAPASFWLWTDSGDAGGVRYAQYPGERDLIWVIDVGGTRILLLGETPPDATAADVAELRSIIEAMQPRPAT
jgi:hypothetical protein